MVNKGIDLFRLVGVNHQSGPLVRQEEVFVLVDDVQPGLEDGEKEIFFLGLVKELVVDI